MQLAVKPQTLSDESKVFDVIVSNDQPFPAPSEATATLLADVCNEVIEGFDLCRNDKHAALLATAIREALALVLDPS